jgi:hypothetical protein
MWELENGGRLSASGYFGPIYENIYQRINIKN